jgi:exosortase/archaeosortase family protein
MQTRQLDIFAVILMHKYTFFPFAVFAVSIALLIANSLATTNFTILDTDPSTYIVIPMLMLIFFPFFYMKENIEISRNMKDLIIGASGFIIYIIATAYIRFLYPLETLSFKTDMLLLPLAIISLIAMIFGISNIKKFKVIIIYSVFASPLLLMPLFNLNLNFASMNTQLVYYTLKIFEKSVAYTAPTIITFNGIGISIGETCAGIGAIIGLIMLLIPIAYLYDGKIISKIYWILSGFLIMIVLNIFRMFSIAIMWIGLNLDITATYIHDFAGVFIFYISIVVMILIIGRYKLEFPKQKRNKKIKNKIKNMSSVYAYAVVIAFSLIYFIMTLNYANYTVIAPQNFTNEYLLNFSNSEIHNVFYNIGNNLDSEGYKYSIMPINNFSAAIIASNSTFNSTNSIMILITTNRGYTDYLLNNQNNSIEADNIYLDDEGHESEIYFIKSDGLIFLVVKSSLIGLSYTGNATEIDAYTIIPGNSLQSGLKCSYDALNTELYSLFFSSIYNNSEYSKMNSAYCISDKMLNNG